MRKLLSLIVIFLLYSSLTQAQTKLITGKITDQTGQPVPYATIRIKGTTHGSSADGEGNFSIRVNPSATLIITGTGLSSKEFPVGSASSLNIQITRQNSNLSEVVVVGYGTQERKNLTGAVGKVQGADISRLPAPSFDKELAGRMPGVRVTESSGLLGSPPVIRVRGDNSLTSGVGPLFVVDGVPIIVTNQTAALFTTNPLADINPSDIQSVEVLKDGSASAIYGSRAANGIVLITTKRGRVGKAVINYDTWMGYAEPSKKLSVLNADQFIQISNEKFANSGVTAPQALPTLDPNGRPYNTNWQDVVFRKAFQQNHNLSVAGGTENSSYYFSAGYTDLNGDIVGNSLRKYSLRGSLEQKAINIFTFGFNTGLTYTQNKGLNVGTSTLSGNVTNALLVFPNVPVFNADGTYNLSADKQRLGRGANLREIDNNYTNIKYVLDKNIFRNQVLSLNGTAFVDVAILNGLNARSQIGVNAQYGEDYQYLDPVHGDGRGSNGVVFQQYLPVFNYVWTNTLNYNKVFGEHRIGAVGGIEFQKSTQRFFTANGTGISNTYFGPDNLITGSTATPTIFGGEAQNSIKSYFGRVNYAYGDKYLLTLTYRTDYISNLGPNSKPANLPGASVGWRVSKESFFTNSSALSFIDDLKIRASYAKTGNSDINPYPYASTYSPVAYGSQSGLAFGSLGNGALLYETAKKLDIGLDLTIFKNRIAITADYYKNSDDNLILNVQTAPSLGVPGLTSTTVNTIAENVGTMYNKGFELAITSHNITSGPFTWTTDLNISFNKNKVTALYQGQDLTFTYNIIRAGYAKNDFFGYQYEGVNPANGNPIYLKSTGQLIQGNVSNSSYFLYDPKNPTNLTTASSLSLSDKVILGHSIPTYQGGFNNTFTYKRIELNVFFTFSGGNKVYNATRQEDLLTQAFNNNGTEILRRWTTPGQITDVPKLYYGNGNFINVTGNTNSRFLEDGKFIRAQEIRLGYSLPTGLSSKARMNRVNIYCAVQNAFIIAKYKGVDPEISNLLVTSGTGVDFNANPRPRTFVAGLNVAF